MKRDRVTRRDTSGRTHLVVRHDVDGHPQGLALSEPLFNEPWQDEVAVASASTALGVLRQGRTRERAAELGLNAMAGASTIIDGMLRQSSGSALACRPGCVHCCYQAVGVSPPEVFAIYHYLSFSVSHEARQRTFQRIREMDEQTRGLEPAQRLAPEFPCPFLQEQRCSIYEVRPLACRGKNSLDADACERSLHDVETRQRFLAGTFSVPCFVEPVRVFHAVAAGVQLALDGLFGLTASPLELTRAMRVLIDDPEAITEAWLAGKDAFAEAKGADMSQDARILELSGRKAPER